MADCLKQQAKRLNFLESSNCNLGINQWQHVDEKMFSFSLIILVQASHGQRRVRPRWRSLILVTCVVLVGMMLLFPTFSSSFLTRPSPLSAAAVPTMPASTTMSVEANNTLIASGESVTFLLTLYHEDQSTLVWTPLANQQVALTWLNDTTKTITLTTDGEGQARVTWTLTTTSYGRHAFNATFDGTTDYLASWDVIYVEIRDSLPTEDTPAYDIWFNNVLINGSTNVLQFNADDVMELKVTLQAAGGSYLGPGIFKIFDDTMGIELYHEDVPFIFNPWDYPSHSITAYWKVPLHAPEGKHIIRLWYSGDANVRSGAYTRQINVTVQLGVKLTHAASIVRSQENLSITAKVLGPAPENKQVFLQYKPESATQWINLTPQLVINRQATFLLQPNKTWMVGNYTLRAELQSLDGSILHAVALSSFLLLGRSQLTVTPSFSTLHANQTITFSVTSHAADSLTQAVPGNLMVVDVTDGILIFNGTTDSQGEITMAWTPINLTLGIHQLNFSVTPISEFWEPSFTILSMQFVASSTLVPQNLPAEVLRGQYLNVTLSVYREDTSDVIVDPSLVVRLTSREDPTTILDESYLTSSVVLLSYQIPVDDPSGARNFALHFLGNATLDPITYNFTVNVIVPTHFLGYAINYSATKTVSAGMTLEIRARLGDNTNVPIANQQVTVTIGSSLYLQGITDASGWMTVYWDIPLAQPAQLYSIKIEFTGNATAYLLAADNTILDSVTVTPPLGVTALESLLRGTTKSVLVTGPGNEQVTVRWHQQYWNSTSQRWEFQNVSYLVTLNSSGQYELPVTIPSSTMVGVSYWYLNSSLDPNHVVIDTLIIKDVSATTSITLPPDPILVGISYQFSVTAEFEYDVYVDDLQITTSPQGGWSTYVFNQVYTTRGTHVIKIVIVDDNVTPYLDQTEQIVAFTVKEALTSSVTGPTTINITDAAQYVVTVKGNESNTGVDGATVRVAVLDMLNNNVTVTSVVITTNTNGEATITLNNLTKGMYLLNFSAWSSNDSLWYGTVTQEMILTAWDPTTNLTVILPANGTTYYIENVTFVANLAPEDADAIITWQLYWFNATSSTWDSHGTGNANQALSFVNGSDMIVLTMLNNGSYKLVVAAAGDYRVQHVWKILFTVNNPVNPVTLSGNINGTAPGEWHLNQTSVSFVVENALSWYQYRYYFVEGVHVENQTFLDFISLNFLSDGTYVVHLYVGNDDIQFHHAIITLHVDQEIPNIFITSPVNGSTYSGTSLTLEAVSSEVMSEWWYRVDDEVKWHPWNGSSLNLLSLYTFTNGTHVVEVAGRDLAGNYNTTKVIFFIDYMAPEFYILAPTTEEWLTSRNVSISLWLVSDPTNVTFTYWLEGSSTDYTTAVTEFWILVPSDGLHVLHVLAMNTWTNASTERAVSFWVDTGLPAILVNSPENQSLHVVPWINISTSVSDSLSGVGMMTFDLIWNDSITLISNETLNVTSFDLTGLSNGTYRLVIRVWDVVGNQREVSITFIIEIPALRLTWNEASSFLQWNQQYHVLNATHLLMTFNGTHDTLEYQLVPLMNAYQLTNTSTLLDLAYVPEGNYTLYLRASRFNGTESLTVSYQLVIDVSAPSVNAIILQVASEQNVSNAVVFDLYVNATDDFSPILTAMVNETTLNLVMVNATTHLWQANVIVSLETINASTDIQLFILVADWLNWSSPSHQRTFTYVPPTIDNVEWTADLYNPQKWEVAIGVTEGTFSLKLVTARISTDDGTVITLNLRKKIGQSTYVGTLDLSSWENLPSWWTLRVTLADDLKSNLVHEYWYSPFWSNGIPSISRSQVTSLDDRNSTWYVLITVVDLPSNDSYTTLVVTVLIIDNATGVPVKVMPMSVLTGTTDSYTTVVLLPQPGIYRLVLNFTITNWHGTNVQLVEVPDVQAVLTWHDAFPVIESLTWQLRTTTQGDLLVALSDDHGIAQAWVTVTNVNNGKSWNVTLSPVNDSWYRAVIDFNSSGNYSLIVHVVDDANQHVTSSVTTVEIAISSTSSAPPSTEIFGDTGTNPPSAASSTRGNESLQPSTPVLPLEAVLGLFTILGGGTIGARWYRRREDRF